MRQQMTQRLKLGQRVHRHALQQMREILDADTTPSERLDLDALLADAGGGEGT